MASRVWYNRALRFDPASRSERELSGKEPGFDWIFSDVAAVVVELFDVADDVIVALGLPEIASFPKRRVDLPRGEFFPRPCDIGKRPVRHRERENVNVVWHNHESIEEVAIVIEMTQRLLDDLPKLELAQQAATVAFVEPVVFLRGEAHMVVSPQCE